MDVLLKVCKKVVCVMLNLKKKEPSLAAGPAPEKTKKSLNEIEVPGWVAAVVIIGLLAVIALVFLLRGTGDAAPAGTTFADAPSSEATQVEVLPQKVRSFTGGETKNPFASDNLNAVQLTGIIKNSAGKATVILQTGEASYIANEGETLPDSEWKITKVGDNYATFSLGTNKKTIWLNEAEAKTAVKTEKKTEVKSNG